MKIKLGSEMIYIEKIEDWSILEEDFTDHMTSQDKAIHIHDVESWMVPIAIFVIGQIISYAKERIKARKDEEKYAEFLKILEQHVDKIVASESEEDLDRARALALHQMIVDGVVTIEIETDVEMDLFTALNSIKENKSYPGH